MMDKIFALIERFVVAVEAIAVSLQETAHPMRTFREDVRIPEEVKPIPTLGAPVNTVGKAIETARDYSTMEYADLVDLARRRGIDIPPRTRTNTVIKMLQESDAKADASAAATTETIKRMDAAQGVGEFARTEPSFPTEDEPAAGDTSVDPFATEEVDPFAGAEEPKTYTRDEVMKALQALMASKGHAAVLDILKNYGRVEAFKNLLEDKYAAVMAAVEKAKG